MKDVGHFNQTVETYGAAMLLFDDVIVWSNENVPVYLEKVRQSVGPAVDKVVVVANDGIVFVKTNAPVVVEKVRSSSFSESSTDLVDIHHFLVRLVS